MTRWPSIHAIRDGILFAGGLALAAVLTGAWLFQGRAPDASLLVLAAAMMGLPGFLRADEKRRDDA